MSTIVTSSISAAAANGAAKPKRISEPPSTGPSRCPDRTPRRTARRHGRVHDPRSRRRCRIASRPARRCPDPATARATKMNASECERASSDVAHEGDGLCDQHDALAAELVADRPPQRRGQRAGDGGGRQHRTDGRRRSLRMLREVGQERHHDHRAEHVDQRDAVDRDEGRSRRAATAVSPPCGSGTSELGDHDRHPVSSRPPSLGEVALDDRHRSRASRGFSTGSRSRSSGSINPTLASRAGLNFTARRPVSQRRRTWSARCIGALGFGYLTDRFGRRRLFLVTLGWYLVCTHADGVLVGLRELRAVPRPRRDGDRRRVQRGELGDRRADPVAPPRRRRHRDQRIVVDRHAWPVRCCRSRCSTAASSRRRWDGASRSGSAPCSR